MNNYFLKGVTNPSVKGPTFSISGIEDAKLARLGLISIGYLLTQHSIHKKFRLVAVVQRLRKQKIESLLQISSLVERG